MGVVMGNYYLIARNIDTNQFKILELKSKWYLKDGSDQVKRANRLEEIDLVTTRFKSKEEMAERLFKNNYINHLNYDFFIVRERKSKEDKNLKIFETIYNTKESRTNYFRTIAYESLKHNINISRSNIRLMDKFVTKLYYSDSYRKIVNERLTGLPKKLVDIFGNISPKNTIPYNLKYQNRWIMNNYSISRNIIDSFNRYDNLNGDFNNHIRYYKQYANDRAKIKNELLEVCSKDYITGQLSFFQKPIEEKKINKEEKYNYVMSKIKNFGFKNLIREEKKVIVNLNGLAEPSKNDVKILKKSLPSKLLTDIYLYNLHKSKLEACKDSFGETSLLYEDLRQDIKDIKKSLSKDEILDRTYQYLLVYNRLKKKTNSEVESYQKNRGKK